MRAGLEMLGINVDNRSGVDNNCDGSADSACGRGAAATRVMILLTDGVPNVIPPGNTPCDDDPNLWPNGPAYHDCGIYYAKKAAEAGVTIYTIGLGNGVDIPWLQAIAEETRGTFYQAPSPNELDLIFDDILSNIYVRLVR
jgi:Mg-chelatase subunit ChlD